MFKRQKMSHNFMNMAAEKLSLLSPNLLNTQQVCDTCTDLKPLTNCRLKSLIL